MSFPSFAFIIKLKSIFFQLTLSLFEFCKCQMNITKFFLELPRLTGRFFGFGFGTSPISFRGIVQRFNCADRFDRFAQTEVDNGQIIAQAHSHPSLWICGNLDVPSQYHRVQKASKEDNLCISCVEAFRGYIECGSPGISTSSLGVLLLRQTSHSATPYYSRYSRFACSS